MLVWNLYVYNDPPLIGCYFYHRISSESFWWSESKGLQCGLTLDSQELILFANVSDS